MEPSALYADLPSERTLTVREPLPLPSELTLWANQALAREAVRGSTGVRIEVWGGTRAVLRQIALHRLLCVVRPGPDGSVVADVSGPLALFRRTTMYGRALASLVPVLRGADRFTLTSRCSVRGRELAVRIGTGDPVFPPGAPLRRTDSRLEDRFARDFAKAAPDWDLVREPEPVEVDGTWIFPDFALQHRRDAGRRWLLEIVGFWTPEYLAAKLDRLRRSGRRDLLVCLDLDLGCGPEEVAGIPRVIGFRKRVDATAVLAAIGG